MVSGAGSLLSYGSFHYRALRVDGKGDPEDRSGSAGAGAYRHDRAVVLLDDPPADREPKPGPGDLAVAMLHPVEFIEDTLQILRRNPLPLIGHIDRHAPVAPAGMDADRRSGRGISRGIVEQIDEHLLDQHEVEPQQRKPRLDGDVEAMVLE